MGGYGGKYGLSENVGGKKNLIGVVVFVKVRNVTVRFGMGKIRMNKKLVN